MSKPEVLRDIYARDLNKPLNPAVSADDLNAETIETEIDEYVFTDEIINGLYKILDAIAKRQMSYASIWINGYYGSGKSHFLKYLNYCVSKKYTQHAMERLLEAVEDPKHDPFQNPNSQCNVDPSQVNQLIDWYKKAEVDIILFNIQDYYNPSDKRQEVFTEIFFKMFNRFQGFNSSDIGLAQIFERVLQQHGLFDTFKKEYRNTINQEWEKSGYQMAKAQLDELMDFAKEIDSKLSVDSIKSTLINDNYDRSTDNFVNVVNNYLESKGDNYRLIFLVDEVSQFINNNSDLLLDLQQLMTRLSTGTDKRVWTACTAQQELEEIPGAKNSGSSTKYGKIMGRFEVRVSLRSSEAQYITRERILKKNSDGIEMLQKFYRDKKQDIEQQFKMPHTLYNSYENEEDFIGYYPFVPYQFTLIGQVFAAFEQQNYVLKEVKDNERSILRITNQTAKQTSNQPLGPFISFDQFYSEMFSEQLVFKGQRAIEKGEKTIAAYKNSEFGMRVVHVLFMISNLMQQDQVNFPASIDSMILLLMRRLNESKNELRAKIEDVLAFLKEKHIVKVEIGEGKKPDTYSFFSDDEGKVADAIANQGILDSDRGDFMSQIIIPWLKAGKAKETVGVGTYAIREIIYEKNFFSNNPDLEINYEFTSDTTDAAQYAFNNPDTRLTIFMTKAMRENKELADDFEWFCKIRKYAQLNLSSAPNATRANSIRKFSAQAEDLLEKKLRKGIQRMFLNASYISAQNVLNEEDYSQSENGAERYRSLLERHVKNVYKYADLSDAPEVPTTLEALRKAILRPVEPNEYQIKTMIKMEEMIENYIRIQGHDVALNDILNKFRDKPFGWRDLAIIYAVNELIRRGIRDLSYNGYPNCPAKTFAEKCTTVSEQSKFYVVAAEEITQELLNNVVLAWRNIFSNSTIQTATDSKAMFIMLHDNSTDMKHLIDTISSIEDKYGTEPFIRYPRDAYKAFTELRGSNDPKTFFETVVSQQESLKDLVIKTRGINSFINDYIGPYQKVKAFVIAQTSNFESLPDKKDKVEQLCKLYSDDYPVDNMQLYFQIMKELKKVIEDKQAELRKKITEKYKSIYEELTKLMAEQSVSSVVLPAKTEKIESVCSPNSLAMLLNNINDANTFKDNYRKEILLAAAKAKGGKAKEPIHFRIPATTSVLTSAEEVDNYLANVRKGMMSLIDNDEQIYV